MYEPKIIGFLCTWCSYTGADTAGISRMKYPANLRAVRVPCSGRVSPELVMRAFDEGADGVLILGCHIGECHYETGNHRTAKRLPSLQSLLSFAGLEPERLRLDWVSASEGERFARIVKEFTDAVRVLGPVKWRVPSDRLSVIGDQSPSRVGRSSDGTDHCSLITCFNSGMPELKLDHYSLTIQAKAHELLSTGQVSCVIGYETGPRGRVRPAFIDDPGDVGRLVWSEACTHNLARYLPEKLSHPRPAISDQHAAPEPVAVVVKPSGSRAINVLLAENGIRRDQVYLIGVISEGSTPVIYDYLVRPPAGAEPAAGPANEEDILIDHLQSLAPGERMEFWLSQFDRCIRCYACRQACPMCNCPTCLYERDDALFVGAGIELNEKRAFHLGRAYHLAGRCVDCHACEDACPVNIPIGLLNRMLAREMEAQFGHRAGHAPLPSPFVTVLGGEEAR